MVRSANTCAPCNYKLRAGRSVTARETVPAETRFWAKVEKHDQDCPCCRGCWLWTGALFKTGYGAFKLGGRGTKTVRAHRFAYELLVGPIPEGRELDHECEALRCVNPAHLTPRTRAEHVAAARARSMA